MSDNRSVGPTKGPWRVYKDGVHPVLSDGSNGNDSFAICQCFGPDSVYNQRLIAAVWDLAEALKEIIGPFKVCSGNANVPDDEILPVDMTMGELRRARAALQKAGLSAGEGC